MLSRLPLKDKEIINNSFLIHGYYNFHHLLFGRVCDNENNTNYFIGVPGMYCNRERYMASMFGFSNFKRATEVIIIIHTLDTGIRKYRQSACGHATHRLV